MSDYKFGLETYKVKIALRKEMLGTNPLDPNVLDRHIIERQRKLIADKSPINKAINKYLDAKDISDDRCKLELDALRSTIENTLGHSISDDEFEILKEGDSKKINSLKESFSELESKGVTVFLRALDNNNQVVIGSHMILGFLKAAAEGIGSTVAKKPGKIFHSIAYTQGVINQHVSIEPDLIPASQDIKRHDDETPYYLQRSLRAKTAQGPRISLAKSEVLEAGTVFDFEIQVLKNSPLKENHIEQLLNFGQLKGLGQWRNAKFGQFEVIEFGKL
jgi:hypothetical protein